MRTVAALFVETNGAYFGLPHVDPWDVARDARKYAGPHPVVAHPPCSTWCQLAHINQKRYGHKVGDDGGCFASALASVRKWGGVLEHPAESYAWAHFQLPRPMLGRCRGGYINPRSPHREWVAEVTQRAYGHRAKKRTWLYVVADEAPEFDWSRPSPVATVSFLTNHGGGNLPRLSKKEAKATPIAFRDALLSIASSARREAA